MRNMNKLRTLAASALFAVCSPLLMAQTFTYSYSGPQYPIPGDSEDLSAVTTIFVQRSLTITKVTVNVDIEYPRPGDLNLYLYSPRGTRTKLLERNCGSRGTLRNMTFDDSATSKYSEFCPVETGGSFKGEEPLANSNGQSSFGTWRLATENNGSNDIGWIRGFSVTITGTVSGTKPTTSAEGVLNAASFRPGAIAPQESLIIVGSALGPLTGSSAPAGALPSTLGGVSVSFDNQAAGIAAVSEGFLKIQAPASLVPGTKTKMRITSQGVAGDDVELDVVGVSPALYTQNVLGVGTVKAVNQNGTLNSPENPAARGSYVSMYANGLGAVAPPLTTGQVPPLSPLSVVTSATTAIIAGIAAPVSYAGVAPPYPGLYQVNLQIPDGVVTGGHSIFLYSSGLPSQSNVVIFVQ
jgi:uncharacterized protein (TIGR03437 family)